MDKLHNKLDIFTEEEFKLLYNSMSQKKFARRVGTTVNTIMKRRKEYNLPTKPKGRPTTGEYSFKDEITYTPEVISLLEKIDKYNGEHK